MKFASKNETAVEPELGKKPSFFSVKVKTAVNQIRRFYEDLPLGFVDASLIALAERYRIQKILTLDRRHFEAVKPLHLEYLELLP